MTTLAIITAAEPAHSSSDYDSAREGRLVLRLTRRGSVGEAIPRRDSSGAPPGSVIDQGVFGRDLHVRRVHVTEVSPQDEGLASSADPRRTYVARLSREDRRSRCKILGVASGPAVDRAASRRTTADIDRFPELARHVESSMFSPGAREWLNSYFHELNRADESGKLLSVVRVPANALPDTFYDLPIAAPARRGVCSGVPS